MLSYVLTALANFLLLCSAQMPTTGPPFTTGPIPSLNPTQESALSAGMASLSASLGLDPGMQSLRTYMHTATGLPPAASEAFSYAEGDPLNLLGYYMQATETPDWFAEMDPDMKTVLSSAAAAGASTYDRLVNAADNLVPRVMTGAAVMAGTLAVLAIL